MRSNTEDGPPDITSEGIEPLLREHATTMYRVAVAHVVVSYSHLFDRPLEIRRPITSDADDASSDQC